MSLEVSDVDAFIASEAAKTMVAESIAETSGVDPSLVEVTLEAVRRLAKGATVGSAPQRRLAGVKARYTITVPATSSANAETVAAAISDTSAATTMTQHLEDKMEAAGLDDISVVVTEMPAPTVEQETAPTQAPAPPPVGDVEVDTDYAHALQLPAAILPAAVFVGAAALLA